MNALVCELCNSNELVKENGVYVCQHCGTKYTVEEARKLLVEGKMDVSGSTVKLDNSAFLEKQLVNARRAYDKQDWEEVAKYYNLVEQNAPDCMEAVFFSAYGKAMHTLTTKDYDKRESAFKVLRNSISIINDCFETTNEDKETVLATIADAVLKLSTMRYIYEGVGYTKGTTGWQTTMFRLVFIAFREELDQILQKHNDAYIENLRAKLQANFSENKTGGCYVATAVYGSYDCPEVWTLRRYRDNTLAETWYGRAFIRTYYAISPTLVKWFGNTAWFKKLWKGKLNRMVKKLQKQGFDSTPYVDKKW